MTSFRSRLLASAVIAAGLLAVPALAQERGIAALLDQANYWKLQNRPEQVVRALGRVLQADPNNATALSGLAEAYAQLGNAQEAQAALEKLRRLAPADPRTQQADIAVRTSTVDSVVLTQARQLAQAGRNAEAVERYRALFRGAPPPDAFALEYYQTLAGTESGWEEARQGLSRLASRAPNNTSVQLAYAQMLTYREQTRAEGIERLRRLSGQPDSQQSATAAWREALSWIGPGPEAVQPLEGYLRQFPEDAEMQRRLEEARNPPQARADDATQLAWQAFNANRLREAEERFQALLTENPNDPDGLGGLGLVRLRQGRSAEARRYLSAAIEADPSRQRDWQRALDGATRAIAAARSGGGGATGPDITRARQLVADGNTSAAVPILNQLVARNGADRPDAEALLGDIALRDGNASEAEKRYRAALARRGNFGAAMTGLATALQAQGQFDEAEEIYRRLGSVAAPQVRADALRAEAQRTDDPQAAMALLQTAIQNEPNNPWPRLDLARLLTRQGRAADARQLVEPPPTGRATADQIQAAAILANEQGRHADVVALLNRLPANARGADQNRLLASARVQGEVQAAMSLAQVGQRQEARQRLLAIASRPDPSGESAPAAVRALNRINDVAGAQQAARMAAVAARGQPAPVRLAAASALLEAGLSQEAAVAAQQIETERLSADQRRQVASLQSGVAIRAADQFNEAGDQAAAYDVLAPALRQDPQNPAANLALARLYQGARDPEQAGRIAEAVLSRNPRDTDARQAAMDAAIARRDWNRAEGLLAEGRALLPGDPRIAMLEARLARAWGDHRRARAALEAAAQQRRSQIGLDSQTGLVGGVTVPQAAVPNQAPQGYENPFRRMPLAGPGDATPLPYQLAQVPSQDPLLGEINRQLQEVRQESAPRMTPTFGMRTRSGDDGIDGMTEVHAGTEGSIAVPGIGGRLVARASAVNLDGGQIQQSLSSLRRVGGNALTLPGLNGSLSSAQARQASNYDASASGIALGAAYSRGNFTVDIGTTPVGFDRQNMVGGIEVAPEIADGVRLRLTAERRAVTDSVLSWAGLRDPAFGQLWGGVTRTGGRGQLEFTSGETNFYIAAGYYSFDGEGVASNSRIEAGAGVQIPIWRNATDELVSGLDLVYFGYEKNLRFFSLGHGGYFSPQSFVAANVPIDYRGRSGDLSYRLGATVGFATFTEDRAAVFPTDPTMQAALESRATNEADVSAFYAGQSKSGLTGGIRADMEYQVTRQLRIGGALRYDRAADWDETRGMVYARYNFDR